MKKSFTKLSVCFLLLFCNSLYGQQFKWVKGGGTIYDFSSLPSDESEQVYYTCTDPNGNIYALSQVGNDPIHADTFYRAAGSYGAIQNILLTSYNCSGQMRWAKLIASSAGECIPYGLATDNLGHVYVAGYLTNGTLYIGYDTTITGLIHQTQGLIQFDTIGHFKWIRYVGDNTLATEDGSYSFGSVLTIDGINNAHFLNYTKHGVHITPTVTSIGGVYDLVYNPSGTMLSHVRLDLDSEWYLHEGVIDPVTNKLYVCGEINYSIYGGFLTDTSFAAAFDISRNKIWQYYTGNDSEGSGLSGIILDQSKHLHFSGGAATYSTTTPTYFYFNGDTAFNTHHPLYNMSVILTTDTNGHPEWIKKFDGSLNVNYFNSITQLPHNKMAVVGTFAGSITDGMIILSTPPGEGYSPYIVIVDSASDMLTVQKIHGDGFYNAGTSITSDKVGNIYVGGQDADSIWAGTMPAYHSVGGNTDFFVMKYGVDCSCTSAPIATYTDTGTHTIGVSYTGTTTGLDSIVWNFGDGHTATGTPALHTYSLSGTYHLCVTVYTTCGSDIHCRNVTIEIPSENTYVIAVGNIKVYPNPAKDELNITGVAENTQYRILSITGNCVCQGVLQQRDKSISMKKFNPGIYILELTEANGERTIVRVIKE